MTIDTPSRPAELSDYTAVLSRRRALILIVAVIGAVIGAAVIPALSSQRTFAATERLSVTPLGSETTQSTTSGNGAPTGTARYADLNAMNAAMTALGPLAGRLDATGHAKPANRGAAALSALTAKPVAGTNWVDMSFTDSSSQNARLALDAYVTAYIAERNAAAARHAAQQAATLQRLAKSQLATLALLSAQADAQRAASGGAPLDTLTQAELAVAQQQYENTKTAQVDQQSQQALRGAPTSISGPIVVRSATRPTSRTVLLVAGLVAGLLLGVGAALLTEALRRRVLTPAEAEEATGLPVLAVVPSRGRVRFENVVREVPFCPAAEGYQRARAVLQLAGLGTSIRTIAVLGAERGSGKTSFALNLAQSLANQQTDVVLVSADMRNPRLDGLLRADSRPGLADVAREDGTDVIGMLVPVGEHLRLLPAGASKGNPAEALSVDRLREMLRVLSEDAIVVIDSPPALVSGEAMTLAEAAEASVVVARVGHNTRGAMSSLSTVLQRHGLRRLGVVLIGFNGPQYEPYRTSAHVVELVPDHSSNGHRPPARQLGESRWPAVPDPINPADPPWPTVLGRAPRKPRRAPVT